MRCHNSPNASLPGLAAALAVALGLAGCTSGPQYVRPPIAAPAAYKAGGEGAGGDAAAWRAARPRDDAQRGLWWAIYADATLDSLMAQVSAGNFSLAAAEAQFRQSSALVQTAQAGQLPTLTGGVSQTRSHPSSTTGPITGVAASTRTIRSLPLNATWEADLWGRIGRAVEASAAGAQASAADVENVRLSLHAQLAQTYFQLRAVDTQRKLLDDTIAAYRKSLELTQNRYRAGVASRADVSQAEAQLHATQAQSLDLRVSRAQLEHAIAVLLGKPPAEVSIAAAPLQSAPPRVPVGLPAELLERRPDIAAAERRVAAANAQIGVAEAAFFPAATLSASYGLQSATAAQWFTLPSRFWSVGPALAQTLFDGGRRKAASAQAIAAYDATVANYRLAVLNGFREVEDNLVALQVLEEEAAVQAEAVKAAESSLGFALNQYKGGVTSYLQVVAAQATALANQRSAADILARRMTASVQLIRALGGGWDAADLPPAAR